MPARRRVEGRSGDAPPTRGRCQREQDPADDERDRVGPQQRPAPAREALDGGTRVARAAAWPDDHERPPGAIKGEAERRRKRARERERSGARYPERRNRLEGEHSGPEPGAVPRGPDGQRQLEAPPLGYLAASLWEREAEQAGLAGRRDEGDGRGDEHRPLGAQCPAHEAEREPDRRRRGNGAPREEGLGEYLALPAPAHGGSEGLEHRKPSGRPGAGDPCYERGEGDADFDQHGSPVS